METLEPVHGGADDQKGGRSPGTRAFSPKRRAGLLEDLIRGNAGCVAGFEFVEPALRFLQPALPCAGVGPLIEAGDKPFRQARALLGREFQCLGFEFASGISHGSKLPHAAGVDPVSAPWMLLGITARHVGELVLDRDRHVPPKGGDQKNPYPPGQEFCFCFREDGSYKVRIMVNAGYEMWRQEGQVEARDGLLILTQVSVNRQENRERPFRYKPTWSHDKHGEFLCLKDVDDERELVLRRVRP